MPTRAPAVVSTIRAGRRSSWTARAGTASRWWKTTSPASGFPRGLRPRPHTTSTSRKHRTWKRLAQVQGLRDGPPRGTSVSSPVFTQKESKKACTLLTRPRILRGPGQSVRTPVSQRHVRTRGRHPRRVFTLGRVLRSPPESRIMSFTGPAAAKPRSRPRHYCLFPSFTSLSANSLPVSKRRPSGPRPRRRSANRSDHPPG